MTFALPARIPEGTRNDLLTRRAGSLRHFGTPETEILRLLTIDNERRCRPPLDIREVRGIARSVVRYAPCIDPEEDGVEQDQPALLRDERLHHDGVHRPRGRDPVQSARRRGARLVGNITRINGYLFSVRGRRGTTVYTVNLAAPSGPNCRCARFRSPANDAGTCAHLEAVRAWVSIHYRGLEVAPPAPG